MTQVVRKPIKSIPQLKHGLRSSLPRGWPLSAQLCFLGFSSGAPRSQNMWCKHVNYSHLKPPNW